MLIGVVFAIAYNPYDNSEEMSFEIVTETVTNNSIELLFELNPLSDVCAYNGIGNFTIPCGICNITETLDLKGNTLIFNNTGISYITAWVGNVSEFPSVPPSCEVHITGVGSGIEIN